MSPGFNEPASLDCFRSSISSLARLISGWVVPSLMIFEPPDLLFLPIKRKYRKEPEKPVMIKIKISVTVISGNFPEAWEETITGLLLGGGSGGGENEGGNWVGGPVGGGGEKGGGVEGGPGVNGGGDGGIGLEGEANEGTVGGMAVLGTAGSAGGVVKFIFGGWLESGVPVGVEEPKGLLALGFGSMLLIINHKKTFCARPFRVYDNGSG